MKRIDDIKEYLHGNRKGKAANRMEREALSDPFLFEALEGLTSTPGDPLDDSSGTPVERALPFIS